MLNWGVGLTLVAAVGGTVVVLAVSLLIWRVCFPISWHLRKLRSNGFAYYKASGWLVEAGEAAVPPLIRLLERREFRDSARAAEVLGAIGDPRAVLPLIKALTHDDVLGPAAAEALGAIGDKRAVEPLVHLVHSDESIGEAAKKALVQMGELEAAGQSTPQLLRTLKGQDSPDKFEAIKAMGERRERAAVELLIRILLDQGYCRIAAAEALGRIGDGRAVDALTQVMSQPYTVYGEEVGRARPVFVIDNLPSDFKVWLKGTRDFWEAMVRDGDLRFACAEALAEIQANGDGLPIWAAAKRDSSKVPKGESGLGGKRIRAPGPVQKRKGPAPGL